MNFSISPPCRAIGSDIASKYFVQEIDDVIARGVIRDPREITQIADHDRGAHRRPASPPGGAGQNELAGMGPDIGFEQGSREPVLDTNFAD
jgi:hypothetical protein